MRSCPSAVVHVAGPENLPRPQLLSPAASSCKNVPNLTICKHAMHTGPPKSCVPRYRRSGSWKPEAQQQQGQRACFRSGPSRTSHGTCGKAHALRKHRCAFCNCLLRAT
eukprot:833566-Alexandrium_andersonii.AAC.1